MLSLSHARRSSLLAVAALALAAAVARAAPGPLPGGYVTNGSVNAIAVDDQGRAYVGGDFTRIGPGTGSLLAVTAASSTLAAGLADVDGPILAMAPDGTGGVFIGGSFDGVGGAPRKALAHIRADGSLDPDWNPGANSTVRALALDGSALFVGGDFSQLGGAAHQRLGKVAVGGTGAVDPTWTASSGSTVNALSAVGGQLYVGTDSIGPGGVFNLGRVATTGVGTADGSFSSGINGPVYALAASGTTLYVGGLFANAGGASHPRLAKLDTTVPSPGDPVDNAWAPAVTSSSVGTVRALALSGSELIVGGSFDTVNGTPRRNLAEIATSGPGTLEAWDPSPNGEVDALAVAGDDVVVGGQQTRVAGQRHSYLGKVSLAGGTADATWDPNPASTVSALALSGTTVFAGGQFASAGPQTLERNGLVRFSGDSLDTNWNPNVLGSIEALAVGDGQLYAGGSFSSAGNQSHQGLARISTGGTATVDPAWRPSVVGSVKALALTGDDVFLGGVFFSVNSATRNFLAKISASGVGATDATWDPEPDNEVDALAVSGGSLYVGGAFTNFTTGSVARNRIAKLATSGAGAVDPSWDPNAGAGLVLALAPAGPDIYVGGTFSSIGGQSRNRIAKLSASGTGAADATWNPAASAGVSALLVDGSRVYAGGSFSTIGGQARSLVARLATTGTGSADPSFVPPTGSGAPVSALGLTTSRLLVGGGFNAFGGLSFRGLGFFDLTGPATSISVPADGARYRQGQTIAASYACSDPDGDANIASCAGPVADGAALDTVAAGPKTFSVTATDGGSNTAAQTVSYVVDGSAPTIDVTTPDAGATYAQGQAVTAAYSCGDPDGSGDVASCAGPAASGASVDTSTPGLHTFKVQAADVAGNAATDKVVYLVTAAPVAPDTAAADTAAPTIGRWRIAPAAFRAATSGASTAARKSPIGGVVSYALSEGATLRATVVAYGKGGRTKPVGSFTIKGKPGANRFTFRGRVGAGKLPPGRYRLSARAIDAAGNRSAAVAASFTIVKR